VAQAAPSPARAPSPSDPGAGRSAGLPRDQGRATELLYRRHGSTVFRYAWHLLGRREDAEDASQATFLAVHRALGDGTAVLEPGAWVLGIARNECLTRLRQRARAAGSTTLDGVEPLAPGGLERLAEVRDQMRVARHTLRALPVPEREAFVLREWLGLGTLEAALTMGLAPSEIESLAGRARRSLVLAVGGLEPAAGCADTRTGLEAGSLGRAGTVHLLRCPVCRGVRRALQPPHASDGAREPIAVVGQRLAGALPGFASGGGGIVALLTTKAAAAPLLAKTAALVTAALVTAGVAQHEIRAPAPTPRATAVAHAHARGGQARTIALAPPVPVHPVARTSAAPVVPVAAPKLEHPRARVVALRIISAPSPTRGGAALAVGDDRSARSRAGAAGTRASGQTRDDGADHGSDGSSPTGEEDRGSADRGRDGDTANETSPARKPSSGTDDHASDASPSRTTPSFDDGSEQGRGGKSERSSGDGSTPGSDRRVTTPTTATTGTEVTSEASDANPQEDGHEDRSGSASEDAGLGGSSGLATTTISASTTATPSEAVSAPAPQADS
jgi:RNA polymerase sigma-70 factor (ECF subfamily)